MFSHSHWGNLLMIFNWAAKSTDYRLEFKVNETQKSVKNTRISNFVMDRTACVMNRDERRAE